MTDKEARGAYPIPELSRRVAAACASETLQRLFREDMAVHSFLVKFTDDARRWEDIPPMYRTLIEYAEKELSRAPAAAVPATPFDVVEHWRKQGYEFVPTDKDIVCHLRECISGLEHRPMDNTDAERCWRYALEHARKALVLAEQKRELPRPGYRLRETDPHMCVSIAGTPCAECGRPSKPL